MNLPVFKNKLIISLFICLFYQASFATIISTLDMPPEPATKSYSLKAEPITLVYVSFVSYLVARSAFLYMTHEDSLNAAFAYLAGAAVIALRHSLNIKLR